MLEEIALKLSLEHHKKVPLRIEGEKLISRDQFSEIRYVKDSKKEKIIVNYGLSRMQLSSQPFILQYSRSDGFPTLLLAPYFAGRTFNELIEKKNYGWILNANLESSSYEIISQLALEATSFIFRTHDAEMRFLLKRMCKNSSYT